MTVPCATTAVNPQLTQSASYQRPSYIKRLRSSTDNSTVAQWCIAFFGQLPARFTSTTIRRVLQSSQLVSIFQLKKKKEKKKKKEEKKKKKEKEKKEEELN